MLVSTNIKTVVKMFVAAVLQKNSSSDVELRVWGLERSEAIASPLCLRLP